MRKNWHLITDDETAYKTAFVAKARPLVGTAHRDASEWNTVFATHQASINQITGWRLVGDFRRLLKTHPQCLRDAIPVLKENIDADAFWNTLENALGGESIDKATYSQLQGVGARATIASLLLFLDDADSYPMFRKLNYGRPLVRLTGEPLDNRTPGTLLSSYYAQIDRLKAWLHESELPVQTNLDVQGVLWVLNYKRVLDQHPD